MSAKSIITFQTADQSGAGTDSNIFVTFRGLKGDSPEYRLQNFPDHQGHSDLFERGEFNKFAIPHSQSLGMIYAVEIRSDGRYSGSDWRLASVKVEHLENNVKVTDQLISVNQWLDEGGITKNLYSPTATVSATGEIKDRINIGTPRTYSNHRDTAETYDIEFKDELFISLSSAEDSHFDETTGVNFGAEIGGEAKGAKSAGGKFSAGVANSIQQAINTKINVQVGKTKTYTMKKQSVIPPKTQITYTPKWVVKSEQLVVNVKGASIAVNVPLHLAFAGEDIKETKIS